MFIWENSLYGHHSGENNVKRKVCDSHMRSTVSKKKKN